MFSMNICLLTKRYNLLRVKMKKHLSAIEGFCSKKGRISFLISRIKSPILVYWYQLIPQDTLLRCVVFLVSLPSKCNNRSEGKFFNFFFTKFASTIKQIWATFLSSGLDGIKTQKHLVHKWILTHYAIHI